MRTQVPFWVSGFGCNGSRWPKPTVLFWCVGISDWYPYYPSSPPQVLRFPESDTVLIGDTWYPTQINNEYCRAHLGFARSGKTGTV